MRKQQTHGTVLAVAAHPDDEVLGCGGALAHFARKGYDVHVLLLADGESSRKQSSVVGARGRTMQGRIANRNAAADRAAKILGCHSVEVLALPDNRLDSIELLDVVKHIERVVRRIAPTIVFTHHGGDVNVDHRIAHEAVLAACRPQPNFSVSELLFFEVPSSTEWRPPGNGQSFNPNWFIDISATLERKLKALECYRSELRPFPHPRSLEGVSALARWRGATVGVEAAEAFVVGRKIVR